MHIPSNKEEPKFNFEMEHAFFQTGPTKCDFLKELIHFLIKIIQFHENLMR